MRTVYAELLETFTKIFQACLDQGYYPRQFREVNTVILKKLKKIDYSELKAYRPITLLDTLGKALETVISKRLSDIVERKQLLPEQ